jgi:hypothetical protein
MPENHVSSERMKSAIQSIIKSMMDRVMEKVLVTDPFIPENHRSRRPLYAALVPDEIFKGSHFERRFVTPFGKAWERLAQVSAEEGLGTGILEHKISGAVRSERLRRIHEVLDRLEHPTSGQKRVRPNWNEELSFVLRGRGEKIPTIVISDVWVRDDSNGKRYAFELKSPMPNSDQTKVIKENLLKLYSMEPPQIDGAYFALPYNPYGRRQDYAWSYPSRWFNMKEDETVLIGDEFWDKIGGQGTYRAFIDAVNEIGITYRGRIYREFLGIDPPEGDIEPIL